MAIAILAILIGLNIIPSADKKPKVVVVLKDLHTQYFEIMKAGAEQGFQSFDVDGQVIAPRYSTKKDIQENLLENILKQKPDVLIVSSIETPGIMSKLQKFVKNGIPVVLVDTDVPLKNKASYIGTDNFELGKKAGELLASELQPGDEVALIAGDLSSPVSGERIKGAKVSLEAAGIKIASEKVKISNEPLPVKKAMKSILQNYPNIKGVFATTDIMALSALEVMKEYGYKIPVIGADGISEMIEAIEKGRLTSTVAQNPYDMGYKSVETALKIIKGEQVEKKIDTGVDIIIEENAKMKLDFIDRLLR